MADINEPATVFPLSADGVVRADVLDSDGPWIGLGAGADHWARARTVDASGGSVVLEVEPAPHLAARVTDEDGRPVEGAVVTSIAVLANGFFPWRWQTRTDGDGRTDLLPVPGESLLS
jgi:hypothetical protein